MFWKRVYGCANWSRKNTFKSAVQRNIYCSVRRYFSLKTLQRKIQFFEHFEHGVDIAFNSAAVPILSTLSAKRFLNEKNVARIQSYKNSHNWTIVKRVLQELFFVFWIETENAFKSVLKPNLPVMQGFSEVLKSTLFFFSCIQKYFVAKCAKSNRSWTLSKKLHRYCRFCEDWFSSELRIFLTVDVTQNFQHLNNEKKKQTWGTKLKKVQTAF